MTKLTAIPAFLVFIAILLSVNTLPVLYAAEDDALARGLAAYAASDYSLAFKDLQPLAAAGDAQAQFTLSWMYRSGNGVALHYETAATLLQLAAEKGHAEAQLELSTLYFYGLGVRADIFEGVRWLEQAVTQGVAAAQQRLGIIYMTGTYEPMVKRNEVVGMRLMQMAIDQNFAPAIHSMAELYYLGQSDFIAAEPLFRRAAELGYADSQYYLGMMYSQGQWLQKDPVKAIMWWQLATSNGNGSSTRALQELEPSLSAAQIESAGNMAGACKARNYQNC
jgi:uncharacterized protein